MWERSEWLLGQMTNLGLTYVLELSSSCSRGFLKYAEGEKDAERYGTAWVQRTVSCQDELF